MHSAHNSATRHHDAEPHAAQSAMRSSVKDDSGGAPDVCAAPAMSSAAAAKSGKPLPLTAATSPSHSTARRSSAGQSRLGNCLEASTPASASVSQRQPRRPRMPDAYPWNRDAPAAVADHADAAVVCKGKKCTITYSASRGTVRIARVTSTGKTRTLLNIPVRMIINVETAAEREARHRVRQTNDDATKLAFATNGAGAGTLLCAFSNVPGDGGDALVFAHSRVNTGVSQTGMQSGQLNGYSPSQSGTHMTGTPSAVAPVIRYYVHYVRQRNKEHPTIHTMEFQSSGPAEAVQGVVAAVVQRIYQHGSKHIIAFISAKSGKGKGEHIFEKQVRPLLHFSRHTYQTYLTKRAHDCEDYIANLENSMDSNTVIVAVGGDGMIHETVNGLHRRKLALVRWLRGVTTEVDAGDASLVSLNLSLHLTDEDGNADGLDAQALATPSEETSTALPTKTGSGNGADMLHDGGGGGGSAAGSGVQRPIFHHTFDENKHQGRCGHSTTSSVEATAREAQRIAQRLVQDGWDAVMPLIATVPTGSACGLAKSLDVLSIAEAALSLVHLSAVHMDLLHMSFKPNPEMAETQRKKLGERRYAAAQQRFAQYKSDKAAELQERQNLAEELQLQPHGVTAADATTPFLKDGSSEYRDAVSCATRMPEFQRRVAFMSLSFGVANDIDHGSEPLRWMGNARFHVYGGYMLLQGLKRYNGMLRYLPWANKAGKTMEKLHTGSKMPSPDDFPVCTMRESCPHCLQYTFDHCVPKDGSLASSAAPRGRARSAAATLAPFSDGELLDENAVDFEDSSLPWVTIRGEFCIVLMCNVRDVAQDMLMAPLAHMSDGAIDVVYSRIDPTTGRGGRMEMLKFFMGLESGAHVNLDFVNYVKASALEIKIDAGISMSDGELMPLSSVRMTKMRKSVQMVRSE